MTEVAALQMNVDTSSVLKAANDLDKFSEAAKRAGAASGLHTGSIAKLVAAVQSIDSKLGSIISILDKMAKASQRAAAANDNVADAAAKAARAFDNADSHVNAYREHLQRLVSDQAKTASATENVSRALGVADSHVIAYTQHLAALATQQRQANAHVVAWRDALASQASATQQSDAHILAYRNNLRKVEEDAKKAGVAIKFTAQDSLNATRQLADIGVTAAMGMSPFMIAIQQGPQLLDILQNKAAVTGQTLGAVFRAAAVEVGAFLAPFAPLLIAVAALAAGIAALTAQANDDSGLKKYTTAMGYTKEEVKKLNAVTVTWGDTAKAVFQVGWERIASAFGISTDSMSEKWTEFTDWLVTAIRAGLAGVYAALTGAQNIIPRLIDNIKTGKKESLFEVIGGSYADQYREAQKFMDDVVKQSRKNAKARQDAMAADMYDKPSVGAHQYNFGDLLKDAQKTINDLNKVRLQIGLYGEDLARVTYEQDLLNKASEHGLKLTPQQTAQVKALAVSMAQLAEANRLATFREETKQQFMEQWQGLKDASAQIGVYGRDLVALRYEQEALNRAIQQHITLTENDRKVIRDASQALADKDYQNIRAQSAANNAKWHNEQMNQLDAERGALGLTGKELIAYNYQQELINKAVQDGVAYKDVDIAKTQRQATAYAEARYAIDQQAQAIADAREVTKGFFTDIVDGVRNGSNAFRALADAAVNALNRIIDKLLDKTLDNFLNGGSSSGLLGSLTKLLGGSSLSAAGISASSSSVADTIASNPSVFAKGSAFGTAQRFANGGAFTNSIVNNPTLFKFANGSKFGLMGEEGPEAVMPLARDSNGRLGVRTSGGASSGRPIIQISTPINITQSGSFTTQDAQAMAYEASEAVASEIRRNIGSYSAELDMNGASVG